MSLRSWSNSLYLLATSNSPFLSFPITLNMAYFAKFESYSLYPVTSIKIYARYHQRNISIVAIKWLFLHSMMKRNFEGRGFQNQYEILFCLSGKCSATANTKVLPCYRRTQWLGSIQISLEFWIEIYLLLFAVILPTVVYLGFKDRLKRYLDRPFDLLNWFMCAVWCFICFNYL